MILHPQKSALYRLAIEHGIRSPEELSQYLPLGSSVPKPRLDGWLNRFFKLPKNFSAPRRHINRFKLGADPEFVFAHIQRDDSGALVGSTRVDASTLGFAQGPAFGADNNGRLAEVRPYPSRSAVDVVASILCTLRWMAICNPQVTDYEWHTGAYIWDDGLGGHVHFGRKRPSRKEEVAALDQVEEGLLYLGVYPKEQAIRRRQGDARRQIYGALGDFRLQQHGYEYRTFPSWLDSPELAFLTLVVAKLAVQMPQLYHFKGASTGIEQARLRNFLAYFKGVDDDARLALVLLDRGLPLHRGGNFAPRWGITSEAAKAASRQHKGVRIIPPCIRPDDASKQEVFDYLFGGKPIGFRVPAITWKPIAPPRGYRMCIEHANTIQAKGLGELLWDLCMHEEAMLSFPNGQRGGSKALYISRDLVKIFPTDWNKRFEGRAGTAETKYGTIITTPEWREGANFAWTRRALLNGLLPIFRVKDCKEDTYRLWLEQIKKNPPAKRKLVGSVLYESTKIPL
jgi:Phage phiEco32-like COOH.NH2 ligase-type 2